MGFLEKFEKGLERVVTAVIESFIHARFAVLRRGKKTLAGIFAK